jgi:glycosyltransferase involved in cell wall biosynthesis
MIFLPFFSICIPAYEQTHFLKQTLDSIKNQIFTDYEVILSDDSISDDVQELVKSYDFSGKLKYYRQRPSLGSPENWNFTLQQARGTWIKILHHDDSLFDENTLGDLFQIAQKTERHWIVGAPVHPPPPMNRYCTILYPRGLNLLKSFPGILGFGNCIGVPSILLVKRTCSIPYNNKLIWLVDIDYYLQLIEKFGFFEYLPKPIVWRNSGSHNLTHQFHHEPNTELKELFSLYKCFPNQFPWFLSLIISAKLIRICCIAGITHKNQLEKLDWEHAPFWVKTYFNVSSIAVLQKLLVFCAKVVFKLTTKILGTFLMRGIQILNK